MTFIKQWCSVYTQVDHKGIITKKMTKERGHMYKGLLHLIKDGPNSWILSHELTGYSIVTLNYTTFACAKKATVLIHSLIDWETKDMETLQNKMREENNADKLREIVNADENTLEILRLQLLEKPRTPSEMIALMTV